MSRRTMSDSKRRSFSDWKARLMLAESGNQTIAAECFQRAVATARRQQSKAWELRAMISLARLWRKQGRSEKAFEALSARARHIH